MPLSLKPKMGLAGFKEACAIILKREYACTPEEIERILENNMCKLGYDFLWSQEQTVDHILEEYTNAT